MLLRILLELIKYYKQVKQTLAFYPSNLRQSSIKTTFMNLPLYSGVASQTFITIEVIRPCMQLATLHSIKPILVKTQLTYEEGCFGQVSGTSPPCIHGWT